MSPYLFPLAFPSLPSSLSHPCSIRIRSDNVGYTVPRKRLALSRPVNGSYHSSTKWQVLNFLLDSLNFWPWKGTDYNK